MGELMRLIEEFCGRFLKREFWEKEKEKILKFMSKVSSTHVQSVHLY